MISIPLESPYRDESNGGKIIQNGSLDAELLFIKFLNIIRPKLRLILAKYFRNTKLITEFRIFLMNYLIITELHKNCITKLYMPPKILWLGPKLICTFGLP